MQLIYTNPKVTLITKLVFFSWTIPVVLLLTIFKYSIKILKMKFDSLWMRL